MATSLDINDLDPDAVSQKEEFLVSFLKETYPHLDLTPGRVLRDLLIRPAAILHALNDANMSNIQQSQSILAISENPELSDPALVDAVLSNYRITRAPGSKSTGQVIIVVQNFLTTSVRKGTRFTYGSLQYITTRAFVGVTTAEAAEIDPSTQRLIVRRTDNTYSFVIDVESVDVGLAYKLRRNTYFDDVSPAPAGLIASYAYQDFTGGTDEQTNTQLVEQFKESLSPDVFSGRAHIQGEIAKVVPGLQALSVIGFGDAEMVRDRHNIFSASQGGKADLYVRSVPFPESRPYALVGTLIDALTGTYQISIGRDVAPGFYNVDAVLAEGTPQDQGSLEITSEVRSLDMSQSGSEFVPDVTNLIEGAYSRYQTAIIQIIDTDTEGQFTNGPLTQKNYTVFLQSMPYVKEAQDLAIDRGHRNPQADYLVRAPIPAYCSLSVEIQYIDETFPFNEIDIKQSIVDAVSSINYSLGQLPVSIVHDAIHNVIGTKNVMVSSPITMYARLHKPTGEKVVLTSTNSLVAPDLPQECVSSRTVIFYLSTNDIDLALTKVSALPV